jgi:hypothetical protein
MTKEGDNLVASIISEDNVYTVTFDTTNDTYTLSATSSDDSAYLFSITINGVDITDQLINVVTWNFSEMASLYGGSVEIVETDDDPFGYGGVKLSFSGEDGNCGLNLEDPALRIYNGTATFTAPEGKKFMSIVITANDNVEIDGFIYDDDTATWVYNSGGETSVSFGEGYAYGISTIVFNLADEY